MTDAAAPHRPLRFTSQPEPQMRARSTRLLEQMRSRRSVRAFSDRPIPLDVVRRCIEVAAQAPSGANKQPWTFALVTDSATKKAIREAAEAEERTFYSHRAPQRWLDDLQPFGTDPNKPFLEHAPALIAIFAQIRPAEPDGRNYYVKESVGIAAGMLIMALHQCGLATLTHTPSPMEFLGTLLARPANERAFLLLPVGYPAADCRVPAIQRKPLSEVLIER